MKLRIQGNSLRLRVTQKEVAQLCDCGRIESSIELMPGTPLLYALESSHQVTAVAASFLGCIVQVTVPANLIAEWAGSDQVSIEGESQAGAQLLIEKDFQCLHKAGEQNPDAYPNPFMS
jgi:hypothetical protein